MKLLQDVLGNSSQNVSSGTPEDLITSLSDLITQNIQFLLSNLTRPDLEDHALLSTLNHTLKMFGMEKLSKLWSGNQSDSDPTSLVMGILKSALLPGTEGQFVLLDLILKELWETLLPEYETQIEGVLNSTHGLLGDLEQCGKTCLSEVPQVFQYLTSFNKMVGQDGMINTTLPPPQSNLTFSLLGHLLSLLQPWNVSGVPSFTSDSINTAMSLLQSLSSLSNNSDVNLTQAIQTLNLTLPDLEPLLQLSNVSILPSLLSDINEIVSIFQCVIPQNTTYNATDCNMKSIQVVMAFLQLVPLPESARTDLSSILQLVYEEAMQYTNMSRLMPDPMVIITSISVCLYV